MAKTPKPCIRSGCERPKWSTKHTCRWHWLLTQDPETQVAAADARLEQAAGEEHRARVPEREWPDGERWCAGCQSYVPLFYTSGSRCKACASRATHGTRLKATYGITEETYQQLLRFQGGVCFICRRESKSKRLAVDHDHITGDVRGLLCPDNERGCNKAIIGNIEANRTPEAALAMAERVASYLREPPYAQMLAGGAPPLPPPRAPHELRLGPYAWPPVSLDPPSGQEPVQGPSEPEPDPFADW